MATTAPRASAGASATAATTSPASTPAGPAAPAITASRRRSRATGCSTRCATSARRRAASTTGRRRSPVGTPSPAASPPAGSSAWRVPTPTAASGSGRSRPGRGSGSAGRPARPSGRPRPWPTTAGTSPPTGSRCSRRSSGSARGRVPGPAIAEVSASMRHRRPLGHSSTRSSGSPTSTRSSARPTSTSWSWSWPSARGRMARSSRSSGCAWPGRCPTRRRPHGSWSGTNWLAPRTCHRLPRQRPVGGAAVGGEIPARPGCPLGALGLAHHPNLRMMVAGKSIGRARTEFPEIESHLALLSRGSLAFASVKHWAVCGMNSSDPADGRSQGLARQPPEVVRGRVRRGHPRLCQRLDPDLQRRHREPDQVQDQAGLLQADHLHLDRADQPPARPGGGQGPRTAGRRGQGRPAAPRGRPQARWLDGTRPAPSATRRTATPAPATARCAIRR